MEFYTKYNRPKKQHEKNTGTTKVETSGYITAEQQIENLMLAGKRLEVYRQEQYDMGREDKIDYDFNDPTRGPNFDLSDASGMKRDVEERIKRQKEENEKDSEPEPEPEPEVPKKNKDPEE